MALRPRPTVASTAGRRRINVFIERSFRNKKARRANRAGEKKPTPRKWNRSREPALTGVGVAQGRKRKSPPGEPMRALDTSFPRMAHLYHIQRFTQRICKLCMERSGNKKARSGAGYGKFWASFSIANCRSRYRSMGQAVVTCRSMKIPGRQPKQAVRSAFCVGRNPPGANRVLPMLLLKNCALYTT